LFLFWLQLGTTGHVTPDELNAKTGDDANFTCISKNEVKWEFKGRTVLPTNANSLQVSTTEYRLFITKIEPKNFGSYTCSGIDSSGNKFKSEAKLIGSKLNIKSNEIIHKFQLQ